MDALTSNFFFDSQFTFLPLDKIQSSFQDYISTHGNEILDVRGIRVVIRKEEWDSQQLGKSVCRVVWMDNTIQDLNHYENIIGGLRDYDCYYLRFNQIHSFNTFSSISCSEMRPWHLSTKVSMFCGGEALTDNFTNAFEFIDVIADGDSRLLSQVEEIAATSFLHNRFRSDPHFSIAFIENMYKSWIENECKKPSTRLYALVVRSEVQAFILLNRNISPIQNGPPVIFVSLIATRQKCRDKRIGQKLLRFAASNLYGTSNSYLVANTELRNFTAINFFMTNNFKIQSVLQEYHLWNT